MCVLRRFYVVSLLLGNMECLIFHDLLTTRSHREFELRWLVNVYASALCIICSVYTLLLQMYLHVYSYICIFRLKKWSMVHKQSHHIKLRVTKFLTVIHQLQIVLVYFFCYILLVNTCHMNLLKILKFKVSCFRSFKLGIFGFYQKQCPYP